jgi:hypothetical protein
MQVTQPDFQRAEFFISFYFPTFYSPFDLKKHWSLYISYQTVNTIANIQNNQKYSNTFLLTVKKQYIFSNYNYSKKAINEKENDQLQYDWQELHAVVLYVINGTNRQQ